MLIDCWPRMAELVPISFDKLLKRIYYEYDRTNCIFDLRERKFYRASPNIDLSVTFCGNSAANLVGPAAGPQTQLAQNIVLSWLAGSRILELKTVQIKDRLQLTRPCIDMATIGYNTEWSQELLLDESLREYVKASMIVEILKHWLFAGQTNLDTIFDISVGYDLGGIQSAQVSRWLQSMRNATFLIEEFRKQIPGEFSEYRNLHFKSEIGNSITLSTFHGTPANEIERICEFLLTEMRFHVIIKMNPPMLGKERLEHLLHDKLGYTDIEVNQKAYDLSISFDEAIQAVKRLQRVASKCQKIIGVKFGNTLEVLNKGKFLKDPIQYLSGQPLHVLLLALVDEWRKVFGPDFPISFSAGVDAKNFADMVSLGLVPITTCTDLLRAGGYGRLPQYLYNLEGEMNEHGAKNIEEFILKKAQVDSRQEESKSKTQNPKLEINSLQSAILYNTSTVLKNALDNPRYQARNNSKPPRKIGSHLYLWDCINCDKCIPVCPNDANFFFEVEPVEILYKNVEVVNGSWHYVDGGVLKIEERHQIANFADACNDCGNCDVFCPEDGGPYIEKPRFFGSLESWKKWNKLSGFVLLRGDEQTTLYGRFRDKEFVLTKLDNELHASFVHESITLMINWSSNEVHDVTVEGNRLNLVLDMGYYFAMVTLMKGMTNPNRVNFVNIGHLS